SPAVSHTFPLVQTLDLGLRTSPPRPVQSASDIRATAVGSWAGRTEVLVPGLAASARMGGMTARAAAMESPATKRRVIKNPSVKWFSGIITNHTCRAPDATRSQPELGHRIVAA